MVGTEFGVWATNDTSDNNSWEQCSQNLGNVPVFAIRQQYRGPQRFIEEPTNTGFVYIGTHGTGLWRTGGVVSVEELDAESTASSNSSLKLFPNPATDLVNIEIDIEKGENLNLEIYSIAGKLVKSQSLGFVSNGNQILPIYVGDLEKGNYIMNINGEAFSNAGKLLIQ